MKYEESEIVGRVIVGLYRIKNKHLRRLIRAILVHRKNAELCSKSLRRVFSLYHGIDVGMYSYGWFNTELPPGTIIGRYCSLAKGILVLNGSHPVAHKSSHPFFYNPALGYVDQLLIDRRKNLIIGNDVYIGAHVVISPNVTSISDGAVVAAGSVVIKNVPPFAIVGGNPAKAIKARFSRETVERIIASKWWDKDIEELRANRSEFESFLTRLN